MVEFLPRSKDLRAVNQKDQKGHRQVYGEIDFLDFLDNWCALKLVERMVGSKFEIHDRGKEYDHVEKVQVGKHEMVVNPLRGSP